MAHCVAKQKMRSQDKALLDISLIKYMDKKPIFLRKTKTKLQELPKEKLTSYNII